MTPPADRPLWCDVEDVAARRPGQAAVMGPRGRLTYEDLVDRAGRLAGVLAPAVGDEPAPIVLLLDHGPDVLVGVLGTLMAGGIAAPLDPSDPADRLRASIVHTAPAAIVAHAAHATAIVAIAPGVPVVALERTSTAAPHRNLRRAPAGDRPAVLYRTSGTTGASRAVVHTHGTLRHAVGNQQRHLGFTADDRFTWFALASTSQGGSNLFGALLMGGTLYAHAPRADGLATIPRWLRDEQITVYNSSATLFRALVSLLAPDEVFDGLRVLRLGSERVRPEDFEAWRRHFAPPCVFVNRYSCTEAGSIALNVLSHSAVVSGDGVPVGHPLPGKRVRILDDRSRPVPAGASGEIEVISAFLAAGYWRDDMATAEAFRPADSVAGERSFRTGDLGRLRPDGQLEHLGRVDGRAKIRGHRIELEEIEFALERHPAILVAAAAVDRGEDGADRLVARLVCREGASPSARELREFLGAVLPSSSLPAFFTRVSALPLTPSGKIDRTARDPTGTPLADDAPGASPRNELEDELSALWAEVLGAPIPGVDADFLALGGDSLQGMRVLARIAGRWGVEVSFEELLDVSSVAGLARLVQERRASAT